MFEHEAKAGELTSYLWIGRNIRRTQHSVFPDLAIEQYFGSAPHGQKNGALPDIIRVIVEIGRATTGQGEHTDNLRQSVVAQVQRYMQRATRAWRGRLWGIAIIREHFTYIEWEQPDPDSAAYRVKKSPTRWYRLNSSHFPKLMNEIRDWCMKNAPATPATEPPVRYFDPDARLPPALQKRFDDWKVYPPKQYSTYGPLLAYLIGMFPPDEQYVVKPQPLLKFYGVPVSIRLSMLPVNLTNSARQTTSTPEHVDELDVEDAEDANEQLEVEFGMYRDRARAGFEFEEGYEGNDEEEDETELDSAQVGLNENEDQIPALGQEGVAPESGAGESISGLVRNLHIEGVSHTYILLVSVPLT